MIKDIEDEISYLIGLKTEGSYWDFKEKWHDDKGDLLHDIICMANNLVNHDAYIIIGVNDNAEICGVIEENRKTQQNVIDFLKDKKFGHGCRPNVYVKSLKLEKVVDVIIIKNSKNTPYYLVENYRDVKKYHIYTRIVDTNTPKNLSADFDKVEYLWRKRFGIDLPPLEKAIHLLNDVKKWYPMGTDGIHSNSNYNGMFYHKIFPEFTLTYTQNLNIFNQGKIDEVEQDIYWMKQLVRDRHNSYAYEINLKYNSTVLYSTLAIFADSFRFKRTLWKKEILFSNNSSEYIFYCYVEKDSIEYFLDNWLCNVYESIPDIERSNYINSTDDIYIDYLNNPYDVILCFENNEEHKEFKKFVLSNRDQFLNRVGEYSYNNSNLKDTFARYNNPDYIDYLCCCGKILNEWFKKWKKTQN